MKILHASHKGLPDQRIERAAYVARKHGHQIIFLGMGNKDQPDLDVFDRIVMLPSINNRQAVTDKGARRRWARAVEEISPDIVHANDIIAAEFTRALDVTMVYDDHEYWSAQRIVYQNWPAWKRLAIRPFLKAIPRWEREIVSHHVTITVSQAIAQEHRRYGKYVFVLQNFCLLDEVKDLPVNPQRSGIAYVGDDFRRKKFSPHRDMTGLREHVEFDDFSGLPRRELYLRLTEYKYGLLPFRTNPYTRYSNSAKTFDYLNCGLVVLMSRGLYDAHGGLPYTVPFDSYDQIGEIVEGYDAPPPEEIMRYAHENFVWEAQERTLFEAYSTALELDAHHS